jgi:hypothetical protein
MRRKGFEESKSRRVEESAILARVEAALSTLARVERAPELSEDLRRRIAGTRGRRIGWAWAAGVAVAAAVLVMALSGPTAKPQRDRGTKGPGQRRDPQIAQMTQIAAESEESGEAATGVVMSRLTTKPQRHKGTKGTARRRGAPAELGQEGLASNAAAQDLAVAGPQAENLRHYDNDRRACAAEGGDIPAPQVAGGVILVLGRPAPVRVSGSYYAEVTLADGTKSVVDQAVERDAGGRPQMVRITYEKTEPNAASVQQGG